MGDVQQGNLLSRLTMNDCKHKYIFNKDCGCNVCDKCNDHEGSPRCSCLLNQTVFEYLKNNLSIQLKSQDYYRPDSTSYWFEIWLTNPSGKDEKISSSESFSIYK